MFLDQIVIRVSLLEDGRHIVVDTPLSRVLPALNGFFGLPLLCIQEAVWHDGRLAVDPRVAGGRRKAE
jgi:hypothetical protein